jgi:glycosyltransferase
MKVSIITVVYNNERFVADAINSVLGQDHPDIEYIIIDGASADNTMQVINNYKDRVSKIVSEPDNGLYDAMNKGVELATGDVIGILNSDDVYYDEHIISEVAKAFKDNPGIDAVYGNILFCKQDDIYKTVRRWISVPYKKGFFERGDIFPHPTLFVKKEVYRVAGNYYLPYKIASDYEFMLRAFRVHGFSAFFLNKFFVRMRMGGKSTGSIKNIIKGNREIYAAWKKNNLSYPFQLFILRPFKKIIQFLN